MVINNKTHNIKKHKSHDKNNKSHNKNTKTKYKYKKTQYKLSRRRTKYRTKKINQKAGVKIGKGAFGCVVSPAIKCNKTQNTKNYVSKIVLNKDPEDYNEELKILKYLKKIDPENKYLISLIDECKLNFTTALNRTPKDTMKVEYFYDLGNNNSSVSSQFSIQNSDYASFQSDDAKKQIQQEFCLIDPSQPYDYRNQIQVYGGKNIKPILKNSNNKYNTDYKLIRKYYKYVIKHLLEGCKLMHKNKFVNRDIKLSNMVYSVNEKGYPVFRYIDFNLGEIINKKSNHISYRGTPGYIPIDFYIYYLMEYAHNKNQNLNNKNVKNKLINKVINKFIEDLDIIVSFKSDNTPYLDAAPIKIKTINNKKVLQRKNPTGRKPKLDFLTITDKDISNIYNLYRDIIMKDNEETYYYYFGHYDGMVYKTDIYALGVVIGIMIDHLKIENSDLRDLIKKMTHKLSEKRPNIKECLNHPFFH